MAGILSRGDLEGDAIVRPASVSDLGRSGGPVAFRLPLREQIVERGLAGLRGSGPLDLLPRDGRRAPRRPPPQAVRRATRPRCPSAGCERSQHRRVVIGQALVHLDLGQGLFRLGEQLLVVAHADSVPRSWSCRAWCGDTDVAPGAQPNGGPLLVDARAHRLRVLLLPRSGDRWAGWSRGGPCSSSMRREAVRDLTALDACTFAARPGRLTGFLGPNGAGKTTAMRAVFGLVDLDAGAVRWRGAPIAAGRADRGSATCPRSGACTRACGSATSSCTSAGSAGGRAGTSAAASTPGSSGSAWPTGRATALDALSHGNQQRVQLIAALVNEPELLVLDEPFSGLDPHRRSPTCPSCSPRSRPQARPCCSPATSSTWSRTCARTSSSSTTAGSSLSGDLDELRAAVPQRFVDIRYRGAAPDWSELAAVELVDRGTAARLVCASSATSTWPPWWPSPGTDVRASSRSPTSRRRCRSCSARRWRHERRAARRGSSPLARCASAAGRGPSAHPSVLMILVVVARDRPARRARQPAARTRTSA